jgi:hypothetical protein
VAVSFQITILKVLAGSTGGHLQLADLRRDVANLISSGRDWTDRTQRIAARAPRLNIFSQAMVVRDASGWWITDAGRQFLSTIEKPTLQHVPSVRVVTAVEPLRLVAAPLLPLRGIHTRRSRRSDAGRRLEALKPDNERSSRAAFR